MGRRRHRKKSEPATATAAAADDDTDPAGVFRGMPGFMWLLFETPSGFAIFCFNRIFLEREDPVRHLWANFVKDYMGKNLVWLKEFQEFEDKPAAINRTTGLGKQLKDMLKVWCRPKETLAVGSNEYKEIIEPELGVTCLCNEAVMEVMWGIKNLLRSLVPREQKALTADERLPISKGLELILQDNGFHVKPEWVNDDIVETACFLYDCGLVEKKHSRSLHLMDAHLMEISRIDSSRWEAIKLASALMKITCPGEVEIPPKMFSTDELSKMEEHAEKFEGKIYKYSVRKIYKELKHASECERVKLRYMRTLVDAAARTER